MKTETAFRIELEGGTPDGDRQRYAPGATLSGRVVYTADQPLTVNVVRIAIFWQTDGKGARAVGRPVFAESLTPEPDSQVLAPGQTLTRPFRATLPREPWSFAGKVVSIVWFVTATLLSGSDSELDTSRTFNLRP